MRPGRKRACRPARKTDGAGCDARHTTAGTTRGVVGVTRLRAGSHLTTMSDASLEGHLHRLCGGRYALAVEQVTIRFSGMAAAVERQFYRCAKCGDEQRTVEQREAAEQAATTAMRAQHALLSGREIRQLRESLGLTTQQLGELLYGTPRGVVEGWEKGRYLQNPTVDAMLRSLRDRETLEQRAAKAGVSIPTLEELAAAKADAAARQAALRAARAERGKGTAAAQGAESSAPADAVDAA
jgi:putative zinc finger/helix-turn-helix YgiT family protein